jgi:hypothetical protein
MQPVSLLEEITCQMNAMGSPWPKRIREAVWLSATMALGMTACTSEESATEPRPELNTLPKYQIPYRGGTMRDVAIHALLMVCSGLSLSCDRQSGPFEPSEQHSKLGPSNSAAVVTRQPVGFGLTATDLERGLTAHVTSGPSVSVNCGSAEFSEQTDLLQVVRPNGAVHSRLVGRNLSVGVWLEPLADICSLPFAVGQASVTIVQTDLERVGPGASVLSWHVRGSVTASESGQRYRLVITIHQIHRPDGTIRGNRSDIKLIPVAQ